MTIDIKFFASLRERVGKSDSKLDATSGLTVLGVWQQATGQNELPTNTLIAVNMEYVNKDHIVKDGDEVAFFPPVTGG